MFPILTVPVAMDVKNMDLSGLKGVILSEKPPFFPPAPGWWFVFGVVLIVLFFLSYYIKKRFFPTPYEYALKELNTLKSKNLTLVLLGVELSKLLKRVSIYKFGREQVADLTDSDWKKFLREKAKNVFSLKEADFIAKAAWMPPEKEIAISDETLYNHTKEWIKIVLKGCKNDDKRR